MRLRRFAEAARSRVEVGVVLLVTASCSGRPPETGLPSAWADSLAREFTRPDSMRVNADGLAVCVRAEAESACAASAGRWENARGRAAWMGRRQRHDPRSAAPLGWLRLPPIRGPPLHFTHLPATDVAEPVQADDAYPTFD